MLAVAALLVIASPPTRVAAESATPTESDARYVVYGEEQPHGFSVVSASPSDAVAAVGGEIVSDVSDIGVAATLSEIQAATLSRHVGVEVVADQRVVSTDHRVDPIAGRETPNWGLDRLDEVDAGLDGSFASTSDGAGVEVFLVDTGIDSRHVELAGRVGDGLDLVGDGWGTGDCNGHGTHTASIVAGASVGVAPAATVRPLRILDCNGGGWASDVVTAIDWAIEHRTGPAVLNLSIGGAGSTLVDDAVERAVAAGIVAVAAGGNSGGDACEASPARAPAAITVGASDRSDAVAWFSDVGPCLDGFAPGVELTGASSGTGAGFTAASGTSQSAPLVSGLAALVLSADENATPISVAEILSASASTVTGAEARTTSVRFALPPALSAQSPVATTRVPLLIDLTSRPTANGRHLVGFAVLGADVDHIAMATVVDGGVVRTVRTDRAGRAWLMLDAAFHRTVVRLDWVENDSAY